MLGIMNHAIVMYLFCFVYPMCFLVYVNRRRYADQVVAVLEQWHQHGTCLVYCKQGANRSAAFVVLMIAAMTGQRAAEV